MLCTGEVNVNPFQYSCLENSRDRGAWWATIYGVAQSRTQLKRLSSSRWSDGVNRKARSVPDGRHSTSEVSAAGTCSVCLRSSQELGWLLSSERAGSGRSAEGRPCRWGVWSVFQVRWKPLEYFKQEYSIIPGTGEPGGLLSMGSHRVGHDWSDLAAAAA